MSSFHGCLLGTVCGAAPPMPVTEPLRDDVTGTRGPSSLHGPYGHGWGRQRSALHYARQRPEASTGITRLESSTLIRGRSTQSGFTMKEGTERE